VVAAVFLVAAGALVPGWSTARADADDGLGRSRLVLAGHLGFGGEADFDPCGGLDCNQDLDPTFGGHLRFEFPIGDFFALGPAATVGAFRTQPFSDEGRNTYLDIGLLPRFRLLVEVSDRLVLEPYLGAAGGYTLVLLDGTISGRMNNAEDDAHGWHVAPVGGVQLHLGSIAIVAELGWRYAQYWTENDVDVRQRQVFVNAGLAILL
jgi:hypothetical protein